MALTEFGSDEEELIGVSAPLCGANRSSPKGPCKALAGSNTPHLGWGRCAFHGGTTRQGMMQAAKEEATAALQQLPMFGQLVDITPQEALVFMVRRSAGMLSWLEAKVQTLGTEEVFYENKAENQLANPWIALLNDERDRLVRYSKTAIDAGVAEREVQLAEQQGAMVAIVLRQVLDQLGLDEERRQQANQLLFAGLQALNG